MPAFSRAQPGAQPFACVTMSRCNFCGFERLDKHARCASCLRDGRTSLCLGCTVPIVLWETCCVQCWRSWTANCPEEVRGWRAAGCPFDIKVKGRGRGAARQERGQEYRAAPKAPLAKVAQRFWDGIGWRSRSSPATAAAAATRSQAGTEQRGGAGDWNEAREMLDFA